MNTWPRERTDDEESSYDRFIDDNEYRHSLHGYPASDYDPGLGMDYHEDDYQKPAGHIYSDGELELVVKELLHNSKQVDATDIQVSADNTNITLRGFVKDESEKNAAGSLVQLIHGVGLIKNELEIRSRQ